MLKNIIEGLLMASESPLKIEDLVNILQTENAVFTRDEVNQAIMELIADYQGRGIQLQEVACGWRFQVAPNLAVWIAKLYAEKPPRYSRALLESLALIAYKQPVTRAEIEEIRGVSGSYNIMKTLLEHEWIKIAGYKNVPGKPALFVTTNKFLDYFNLKTLTELPALADADFEPPSEVNASDIVESVVAESSLSETETDEAVVFQQEAVIADVADGED